MVRRLGAVIAVVTLLVLGGCSKTPANTTPPPSGTTGSLGDDGSTPSASASPSATVNPADVVEFSVDGAGPYQIGDKLSDLQSQLTNVGPDSNCPGNQTAQGTGTWSDVHLFFHSDGSLFALTNQSTAIPTPSGAYLGTSLTQLKTIYAKTTNELLNHGSTNAFLVITASGRAIRFDLTPEQTVVLMTDGDVGLLRASFVNGTPLC
jgi:hypothetical protein